MPTTPTESRSHNLAHVHITMNADGTGALVVDGHDLTRATIAGTLHVEIGEYPQPSKVTVTLASTLILEGDAAVVAKIVDEAVQR